MTLTDFNSCRLWRETLLSNSRKFWKWAVLRVGPGRDILDSRILYIVPEIKISYSASRDVLSSVLKAIREGETPHMKKMTIHTDLRYIDPTLVSSAVLQLEECVITDGQRSQLEAIITSIAETGESKLKELVFRGNGEIYALDPRIVAEALVKLKTIGYDLKLSHGQVKKVFSRIRASQDLRLTELHPYWNVSMVPSEVFAGALSRLERVTLGSWPEVTPSQLDSLFLMLSSHQADLQGSTLTLKELMLSSTDLSSVSPEVMVGAIQRLEEVDFWSGKMTGQQITAVLTMVNERRQGRLKKLEIIGPEVGGY